MKQKVSLLYYHGWVPAPHVQVYTSVLIDLKHLVIRHPSCTICDIYDVQYLLIKSKLHEQ